MSLLLKALRQAEQSHASHSAASEGMELGAAEFELDPMTKPKREWVEPQRSSEPVAFHEAVRDWHWPLGLVPTTALLALLVAAGYGFYFYLMTRPQSWTPPAISSPPISNSDQAPSAPNVSHAPEHLPESPVAAPVKEEPAQQAEMEAVKPKASPLFTRETKPGEPRQTPAVERKPLGTPAIAILAPAPPVNFLDQAYAAFQSGRLDEARALYRQSASAGPNPQALLGLAAIAQARGETPEAIRLYQAVLEMSPRNSVAQAALLDLLGTSDPAAATARVKSMISREPSSFLFFTLGNLYADQGRWSDAELAYFEAFQREPGNADYAFNLAVSLDHLKQVDAALRYYETALKLAGPSTRFDRSQALNRVELLR